MPAAAQISQSELDKPEDLAFQRRWWIVERAGWLIMIVGVVAGAAGFLGRGPASSDRVETPDGKVSLEYDRWTRLQAPTQLRLRLPPADKQREVSVAISREYCRHVRVRQIAPTPLSTHSTAEGLIIVCRVASAQTDVPIDFDLEMETVGKLEGWLQVDDHPPLRFSQFVYP